MELRRAWWAGREASRSKEKQKVKRKTKGSSTPNPHLYADSAVAMTVPQRRQEIEISTPVARRTVLSDTPWSRAYPALKDVRASVTVHEASSAEKRRPRNLSSLISWRSVVEKTHTTALPAWE